MSTLSLANIESKAANTPPIIKDSSGTEIGTFCRAWVNFDGSAGAVSIRRSFNISSVVENSTGQYTINFTTAMPDADYVFSQSRKLDANTNEKYAEFSVNSMTTTNLEVYLLNPGVSYYGSDFCLFAFFG